MSKKITTGVEKAYFAILNEDGDIPDYGAVSYLQGLQEFSIVANEESSSIYAENRVWETENSLGEIEVSLTFASILTEDYVALLGKSLGVGGGIIETVNDQAPYIALMLEKTLSGGVKEYLTLFKGRLRIPEDVARTKEGATEFQVKTLAGTFMALNNGLWKHVVRTDDHSFQANTHSNTWGKTVVVPQVLQKQALTIQTAPANAAITLPKTGDLITLTFGSPLVSYGNVSLKNTQAPDAPKEVAITAALDAAKTKLTIRTASQLTAQNKHTLTITGAKDIYGQVLDETIFTYTTVQ